MTVIDHTPLPPTTTTTELLRAAAAGDREAWHRLVDRFEPVVTATVVGLRLQPADAHDAMQTTWLQMVEHHRDIREPEALGGWLRTTARREGLKIIRDRRRTDPLDGDPNPGALRDRSVDVEQSVVDADTVRRLRSYVDVLPRRSAVLVRELFGEEPPGYAELARSTGIPIGSIGPTRGRAVARLRRFFDEGGPGLRVGAGRGRGAPVMSAAASRSPAPGCARRSW